MNVSDARPEASDCEMTNLKNSKCQGSLTRNPKTAFGRHTSDIDELHEIGKADDVTSIINNYNHHRHHN